MRRRRRRRRRIIGVYLTVIAIELQSLYIIDWEKKLLTPFFQFIQNSEKN